jgi:hypothetical protein
MPYVYAQQAKEIKEGAEWWNQPPWQKPAENPQATETSLLIRKAKQLFSEDLQFHTPTNYPTKDTGIKNTSRR